MLTTVADNNYFWGFQMVDGTGAILTNPTNNQDLWLIATQVHTIGDTASTFGNLNVGNVLEDTFFTDPTLLTIQDNLNESSSAQGVNALLESTEPVVDDSDVMASLDFSNDTLGLTTDRLASLRTGEAATGMSAGNMSKGLGAWGQAFGRHANQGDRDGIAGYHANTWGGAVGIDTRNISDHALLGLGLSYGRTNSHSDNVNSSSYNTNTDVDSYQASLYGDYNFSHDMYLNGMVAYGWNKVDTTRNDVGLLGLTANGSHNARQFSAQAEGGKDYKSGDMTLTPNLVAHWVNYNPDSYTETGASGADLHVDGSTLNLFELGGGVKAGWAFKQSNGAWLKPQVRIGYRYAVTDDRVSDTASFTGGGGTFVVNGPTPARSTLDLGASLKYLTTKNWDFTASGDFNWKNNYTSYAGFLRAGYKF